MSRAVGLHLPALLVVDRVSREHLKDLFARVRLGAWAALFLFCVLFAITFTFTLGFSFSTCMQSSVSLGWAVRLNLPALLVVDRISREHLKDLLTGVRLGARAALLLLTVLFAVSLSL